jgi:peptidoglycan/LPS O-acetylase OafA/YrhL
VTSGTDSVDSSAVPGEAEPAHPAEPQVRVPGRPHFPCFDGLRAIAVGAAILQHVSFASGAAVTASYAAWVSHFELGPALFFMISGFLLYRVFVAANFAGRAHQAYTKFLRRRALRILPAYWVALTIIIVLHAVQGNTGFGSITMQSPGAALSCYTLTQIYIPSTFFQGITQAWTLGTEMSFYLFLPVYAILMRRLARDRKPNDRLRIELISVAVLYAISLGWRCWVYFGSGLPAIAEHWLPGYLDMFGLGMGLAAISAWSATRDEIPAWLLALGKYAEVAVIVAIAAFLYTAGGIGLPPGVITPSPNKALLRNFLNSVTAFGLLLPAVFGPQHQGVFRRLMQWKPIAYFGFVSFGVYLYHEGWMNQGRLWASFPLFNGDFMAILTMTVGWAVLSAAVSYRFIEAPFLKLKDRPLRALFERSATS